MIIGQFRGFWHGPPLLFYPHPQARLAAPGGPSRHQRDMGVPTDMSEEAHPSEEVHLDVKVRRELASDSSTNSAHLATLAADPHTGVRVSVAANPAASSDVLQALSLDRSEWVRAAVVANPITPANIALGLARDPAWHVRTQVAEHSRLDPSTAIALAHDPQVEVIRALAGNPHISADLIEVIRNCGDSHALGILGSNPAVDDMNILAMLPAIDSWHRQEIAKRATLSTPLQEALCADEEVMVREQIAEHPKLDLEFLRILASDSEESVRTAVHRNPASDDDIRAIAALLGVQKKVSLHD